MGTVASRDLRNRMGEVLARVAAGERVDVTIHGEVVAQLVPPPDRRPAYLSPAEVVRIPPADAGLGQTLRELDEWLADLGEP